MEMRAKKLREGEWALQEVQPGGSRYEFGRLLMATYRKDYRLVTEWRGWVQGAYEEKRPFSAPSREAALVQARELIKELWEQERREAEAEQWAEGAWLRAAESVGWMEALEDDARERDLEFYGMR